MTATLTAPTTATTIIDSPEWAWIECAADILDRTDAEFYDLYRPEIDAVAHRALSHALAHAWAERGYIEVTEVPAQTFGDLLDAAAHDPLSGMVADEQDYFAAWEAAIADLDFAALVEAAQLHAEYREAI